MNDMDHLTTGYVCLGISTSLLFLITFIKTNRCIRVSCLFFWALSSLITIFHYIAWELTGNGFNESITYHLQFGIEGAGISDFYRLMFLFVASVILLISVFVSYCRNYLCLHQSPDHYYLIPLFFVILLAAQPLFSEIQDTYQKKVVSKVPFDEYFVNPSSPLPSPVNKINIVWIYAESLERTYLDENIFPGLLPEIRSIENMSLSFTNVQQVYGTAWTIAGIVSGQCGIPLATMGMYGNKLEKMNKFLPGVVSISDLLSHVGYKQVFMQGTDSRFAGKWKYLSMHNFEVEGLEELKIKNKPDEFRLDSWGLTDDNLFKLALIKFNELNGMGKPFVQMLLTVNTHHPNGSVPDSCGNLKYGDGSNPILNAVHCSDSLIGEFVRQLKLADKNNNTIIVISSDHLAMPNTAYDMLSKGNRRNLLLFYLPGEILPKKSNRNASMLDAGVTCLHLCGIPITRLGLGRSLISDEKTILEIFPNDINKILKGWENRLNEFWSSTPRLKM